MILSEACTLNVLLVLALAFSSFINDILKWHHNLERYLLTTTEISFMIVTYL